MHEIVGGIGGKTRVLVASLRDVVNMQVLAQKGQGTNGPGVAVVFFWVPQPWGYPNSWMVFVRENPI